MGTGPNTEARKGQQGTELNVNAFLPLHRKERMYISKPEEDNQGHINCCKFI